MSIDLQQINRITDGVIGSAIRVHKALGPGLLETAYSACLNFELSRSGTGLLINFNVAVLARGVRRSLNAHASKGLAQE